MEKILLAPRGQVHTTLLPTGAHAVRVNHWAGSPYAWVWLDPDAPRRWLVDFLMVADGDRVDDELFWPVGAFNDDGNKGSIWTVLMKWRTDTTAGVIDG
jgi:hypothetical protein